ncbi:MAG: ABC transporter ATP-binding protein [Alphaproteobacteria bacterium]|nr:MAG: ABC transporter ATP-binding protein [Alphaproteobacteria bacterium]
MSSPLTHIQAEQVSVRLGHAQILRDVSLTLRSGEVLGLIGPNGAGKSTLLRALLGLVPCEGCVSYDDVPLSDIPLAERARKVAYAPQGAPVHWPLSVAALVGLGRVPHQTPFQPMSAQDQAVVDRVLEAADCAHLKDRTVLSLSGGERANVMLARAMAVEAPFLFADEPVASLDPYHQLVVMETLQQEAARGTGVVVVLHDIALALRFCDRLCILNEGQVAYDGRAREVPTDLLERVYRVRAQAEGGGAKPFVPWERL